MPKKPEFSTIRISREAALVLRAYCDSKGLKLGAALSHVIMDHVKPLLLPKMDK